MYQDKKIWLGSSEEGKVYLFPKMANRHGLIAGATGTGKTVTLKVLAESFSSCGIPVFLADIKGDLSALIKEGIQTDMIQSKIESMKLDQENYTFQKYPVEFWDIYQEKGLSLRASVSEMGPLLMSKVLELNDNQEDLLKIIYKIADDEGLLLLDTKDLKSMISYVADHLSEYGVHYGTISKQSLGVITRKIIALETEGGDYFFGEPALDINDWIKTTSDGEGYIQILDATKLVTNPSMYSVFMLWLLSELFESLPEVGDLDKPKMVFFFDEAHLLFENATKELLTKIEQVVKLIRSKGVGVYFITQSPKDIPNGVLSQLGNKIQHSLHAYTPAEEKAAKTVADSFRANEAFSTYEVLTSLAVGEALVSVLDESGVPTVVQKTQILPPQSMIGTITSEERELAVKASMLYGKYSQSIDRESAYEILEKKAIESADAIARQKEEEEAQKQKEKEEQAALKQKEKEEQAALKQKEKEEAAKQKQKDRVVKSVVNSVTGTVGREIGKDIGGSLGGSFGKRLGGNMGASIGRGLFSTFLK